MEFAENGYNKHATYAKMYNGKHEYDEKKKEDNKKNSEVDGSAGKEFACNTGDMGDAGSIPRWGRCPGEGNGNPFQYLWFKESNTAEATSRPCMCLTSHFTVQKRLAQHHKSTILQ